MSTMEPIPNPIVTPAQSATAFDPTKMVLPIVGAVSFVHLLNDLIQAVLPAIYPAEGQLRLDLHPGGPDHAGVPDDCFHPATSSRALHR